MSLLGAFRLLLWCTVVSGCERLFFCPSPMPSYSEFGYDWGCAWCGFPAISGTRAQLNSAEPNQLLTYRTSGEGSITSAVNEKKIILRLRFWPSSLLTWCWPPCHSWCQLPVWSNRESTLGISDNLISKSGQKTSNKAKVLWNILLWLWERLHWVDFLEEEEEGWNEYYCDLCGLAAEWRELWRGMQAFVACSYLERAQFVALALSQAIDRSDLNLMA